MDNNSNAMLRDYNAKVMEKGNTMSKVYLCHYYVSLLLAQSARIGQSNLS